VVADVDWQKSSFSAQGDCVEVAYREHTPGMAVRDSKLGARSPVLRFTPPEWQAFIAGVKAGEFDLPDGG
jgi:hypothetical protein